MEIASPCINVCRMDAASGLCTGCLRSLEEITRWSRTSDEDKLQILTAVARRRKELEAPIVDGLR